MAENSSLSIVSTVACPELEQFQSHKVHVNDCSYRRKLSDLVLKIFVLSCSNTRNIELTFRKFRCLNLKEIEAKREKYTALETIVLNSWLNAKREIVLKI